MYSSLASAFSIGFSLLHALIPLIGFVIIAAKVTGPARGLGIVGCILLAVSGLMQTLYFFLLPRLARALDGVSVIAVVSAFNSFTSLVGLALVIAAVCAGRARTTPQNSPYPR